MTHRIRTIAMLAVAVAVAAAGCGSGEAEPAPRSKGYRNTTPQERTAARAALARARLGLPAGWSEEAAGDGVRRFANGSMVTLELYLAGVEERVAVADEPPRSLDELVARFRFGRVTDRGSNGDTWWVGGSNGEERMFVVMRRAGGQRFRCAARGPESPALAEALAACKGLTLK